MQPSNINSITLLGSSSGRNAGDAALISGIMDSIDAALGKRVLYEIPTIKPEFILNNYKNNVKPISMLPWHLSVKMLGLPTYQSIMRTDLTLVFDAILFDRSLYNPLFNYLSTLYVLLPRAKRRGKRLGCYNVSAGPVSTESGRMMLKSVCEVMDFITVRDQASFDLLNSLGVSNRDITITADAALNVTPASPRRAREILQELGLNPADKILAINLSTYLDTWASQDLSSKANASISREDFVAVYANALNRVLDDLKVPALFVCTQHSDVPLTRALMQQVNTSLPKALLTNIDYSHYEIMAVLGEVSLLFAMRLHPVILAAAGLTPVIALPHQPKVVHFLRSLELEHCALSFSDFSEDHLVTHILKGWQARAEIKVALERNIPISKEKARSAANFVARLQSLQAANV